MSLFQEFQNYADNLEDFKKMFEINNLSYDFYEEEIKIELAWQKLIFQYMETK